MTVTPWMPEVQSLAHDVALAARGRREALAGVEVSVHRGTDPLAFAEELAGRLARMGMPDVDVTARSLPGPVTLISIEFHR